MEIPDSCTIVWSNTVCIISHLGPGFHHCVVAAACAEPPFFNKDADDAVNYGAMGAIVGHEMTHGFDDQGRKYNAEGNMVDWWTEEDGAEYERRVEVMVQQASAFEVHGTPLQGKLTCGENIAGELRFVLQPPRCSLTQYFVRCSLHRPGWAATCIPSAKSTAKL